MKRLEKVLSEAHINEGISKSDAKKASEILSKLLNSYDIAGRGPEKDQKNTDATKVVIELLKDIAG